MCEEQVSIDACNFGRRMCEQRNIVAPYRSLEILS